MMSIQTLRNRLALAHTAFIESTLPRNMAESRSELNDARFCYSHACITLVESLAAEFGKADSSHIMDILDEAFSK